MFTSKGKIYVIENSPKQFRRTYIKNDFKDGWFVLGRVDWIKRYFRFPCPSFFDICFPILKTNAKKNITFFLILALFYLHSEKKYYQRTDKNTDSLQKDQILMWQQHEKRQKGKSII